MATNIMIPKLGLTMEEALLTKWSVDAGQKVAAESVVAVIETDKISFEIESPAEGWLYPVVKQGTKVLVAQVIGYIAADEAELASLQQGQPSAEPEPSATAGKKRAPQPETDTVKAQGEGWIIASPLARRMAQEHGLDLASIPGSGPHGRIVEADIKKALQSPTAHTPAITRTVSPSAGGDMDLILSVAQEIPIQGIRRAIYNNMHKSLSTQAQLSLATEASAAGMIAFRSLMNEIKTEAGAKISFNAILVKAVALALRKHPIANSTVDGDVIKIWKQIHVGLAVDLGDGLIVPKVRFADTKTIADISLEIEELVEKAKNKSLGLDDIQGGTFTITNLGAWGVDHFTPIVNFPESAILGVGRIIEKPCVDKGKVVIEPRIGLSLSFDHRIIDGAPAAGFFKTLRQMIEEPRLML